MNKILTLLWCCAALLLASCDSGNIHEEMATTTREGLTVRMTGRLRGAESLRSEKVATRSRTRSTTQSCTPKMFERTRDTLRFDVGRSNVGMYAVVEDHLFDNLCSKCHGTNGHAAAGMDLRKGHAYAATVGVASRLNPEAQRIVPGQADNSWLVRVLTEGNEGLTHYKDHTLILNNERDSKYFTLLKDWINAGAKP